MSCHEEKSRLSYQFSKTQNFYDGQKVITHSDPKWLLWQSIIHWVKLGGWVGGAQLSFMGYSPNSHSGFPSQSQSLNNILFWTPWSSRILQTFLIPLKQDAQRSYLFDLRLVFFSTFRQDYIRQTGLDTGEWELVTGCSDRHVMRWRTCGRSITPWLRQTRIRSASTACHTNDQSADYLHSYVNIEMPMRSFS